MSITKKEVLDNIDQVKKYIEEANKEVKKDEKRIEIKNRWTGDIIYTSSKTTLKEAVEEAVESGANLSEANLYGANLSKADLYGANLSKANLSEANLSEANLSEANLYGANLSKADLYGANLSKADLSKADLYGAKFYGRGGTNKIKREQLDVFMKALGFIVE